MRTFLGVLDFKPYVSVLRFLIIPIIAACCSSSTFWVIVNSRTGSWPAVGPLGCVGRVRFSQLGQQIDIAHRTRPTHNVKRDAPYLCGLEMAISKSNEEKRLLFEQELPSHTLEMTRYDLRWFTSMWRSTCRTCTLAIAQLNALLNARNCVLLTDR